MLTRSLARLIARVSGRLLALRTRLRSRPLLRRIRRPRGIAGRRGTTRLRTRRLARLLIWLLIRLPLLLAIRVTLRRDALLARLSRLARLTLLARSTLLPRLPLLRPGLAGLRLTPPLATLARHALLITPLALLRPLPRLTLRLFALGTLRR